MGERAAPSQDEVNDGVNDGISWPLPYQIQTPKSQARPRWWCHSLYRGPKNTPVQVLYSKDKAQSEILAKMFLNEPIVGFDMEWPWNSEKHRRLQEKIGLIQVASEDKIALFHIGLHPGETTEDIIAPSLKKLIESPTIAKTGVNILYADFARLKKYFGLQPQGALELSHLHRLVKFGQMPELLTTKLVKLAHQVEEHLGLPLSKGEVRTSNWSRPLNKKQIQYAASDAYAGFMLFHCMNAKRAALNPIPPLPILAEKYPSKARGMANITDLRLHPLVQGTGSITAKDFFKPAEKEVAVDTQLYGGENPETQPATRISTQKRGRIRELKVPGRSLDPMSKILYDHLAVRRRALAEDQSLPLYRIATNAVLENLARRRPRQDEELLEVKGISRFQRDKYGAEWLEVVAHFLATNDQHTEGIGLHTSVRGNQSSQPVAPNRKARRRRFDESQDSSDSSPAFNTPIQRAPLLHTGLSFTLAGTQLDDKEAVPNAPPSPSPRRLSPIQLDNISRPVLDATPLLKGASIGHNSEQGTGGSYAFAAPPSRPQSHLKRKRETALPEVMPASPEMVPASLSPRSKIFRSKLLAFSKLVTKKLPPKRPGAGPIVSDSTLDHIVTISPQTREALHLIPGIETFAQACKDTDMDLLRNVMKFAPARL